MYSKFWKKSRFKRLSIAILLIPLNIILRLTPKLNYEIFGSMNGFRVCDNSKFLFNNSNSESSFFITKNKDQVSKKNKIIFAYSPFGLFLQMFASKAYWSHGMNDFVAPLICGSHIIGLQHGLPGKTGPDKSANKKILINYLTKRILAPYLLNYYCNEIWSPDKKYDDYMLSVFEPMTPLIKRRQIPRIFFQKKQQRKKKILYAPSHRNEMDTLSILDECGLFNSSFLMMLRDNNLEFYFRPHPLTYEALIDAGIKLPDEIILDASSDIHDSLGSYGLVISDFSGLIIDCWEMNMKTACVCPDLDDIYSNNLLFDWFYEHLDNIRFKNLFDAVNTQLNYNLTENIHKR